MNKVDCKHPEEFSWIDGTSIWKIKHITDSEWLDLSDMVWSIYRTGEMDDYEAKIEVIYRIKDIERLKILLHDYGLKYKKGKDKHKFQYYYAPYGEESSMIFESFFSYYDNTWGPSGRTDYTEEINKQIIDLTRTIPAWAIFKFHTEYGLPVQVIKDIAMERGLLVDIEGYDKLMEEHRNISRADGFRH